MRTWHRDPMEVADRVYRGPKETWNGRDYYVSLGEEGTCSRDDCMRYGFISAGRGRWHTKTLVMLSREARVFVCIPKPGHVGVGVAERPACPVSELTVNVDGTDMPIFDAPRRRQRWATMPIAPIFADTQSESGGYVDCRGSRRYGSRACLRTRTAYADCVTSLRWGDC